MHPLLAKLTGRSAIENWRRHCADAAKAGEKLNPFFSCATNYDQEIANVRAAFEENPSFDLLNRWADLLSRRNAMVAISDNIREAAQILREQSMKEGSQAKLHAAIDEAESALDEREKQTHREDAKRSESLGVPIQSPEVFKEIERMRLQLWQARGWVGSNFSEAVSRLNSIIG